MTQEIQNEITKIHTELELFEDVMNKYEYIIELGKQLEPVKEEFMTPIYRVQGCQSKLWLHPYLEKGKVCFEASGDALIANGLADILIRIYSGKTAQDILDTHSSVLKDLHLSEIISSGRQNGIASMVKRIYGFATEVVRQEHINAM